MLHQITPLQPKHQTTPLPAAIRQGVSGLDPDRHRAVLNALETVFAGQSEWSDSALTRDGFPLELGFHTGKDTLYWTADPARGQGGAAQLAQITGLAQQLGDPVAHPLVYLLPGLRIPHRAGSWLSGRHDRDTPLACKLYTDWADTTACRLLLPALTLPERLPNGARAQVRGIGLGPGPDRTELYYRFDHATPRHMHHVLCCAGLGDLAARVLTVAEDQAADTLTRALHHNGMIASLAQDEAQGPITVTFYFFPRAFWGSDRACRVRFLELLEASRRDPAPYAAAADPIRDRIRFELHHGLIALSVSAEGMAWGVGLRPVASDPSSTQTGGI